MGRLNEALAYRAMGWSPIPVSPKTKRPILPEWPTAGPLLSLDRFPYYWGADEFSIGLITGRDFDVLDIDGEAGRASVADAAGHYVHTGPAVRTGGGGIHLYFQPTGFGNANLRSVLPSVDWRGIGGQVVAPGSVHESGNAYEWLKSMETPIPEVPRWLRRALEQASQPARTSTHAEGHLGPRGSVSSALGARGVPYRYEGGRITFQCPTGLHSDTDWSAKTHPTDHPDEWWLCFGCQAKGDADNILDGSYVLNGARQNGPTE